MSILPIALVLAAALWAAVPVHAMDMGEAPSDPFDYAYCGGKPVYPVIGFNVATACGPRNQFGLGRRGHLMWSIPARGNDATPVFGKRLLSEAELKQLSLLAEVVQLADAPPASVGKVMYDLGVDFQGRPYKRVHAPVSTSYTPANALYEALQALLPVGLVLPDCEGALADFSPTLLPSDRTAVLQLQEGKAHEQP